MGELILLKVNIGPLLAESHVVDPMPFPDHLPGGTNAIVDVVVSSADFGVRVAQTGGTFQSVAQGQIELDLHDTSAASRWVLFELSAQRRRVAHVRIAYMYRNTVIHSQRVTLGALRSTLRSSVVNTDFTLTRDFVDLDDIPDRSRLTIMADDSGSRSTHHMVVRAGGKDGRPLTDPHAIGVPHARLGPAVAELRKALSLASPQQISQSKARLRSHLRDLAPLGWDLYTALDIGVQVAKNYLDSQPEDVVLQVALPTGSSFTVPWGLVYDIYLDSDLPPERLTVCPIVSDWEDGEPLVTGVPRECPKLGSLPHDENVLCPFGFWAYRYSIEQLATSEHPKPAVHIPRGSKILIAQTLREINRESVAAHIQELRSSVLDRLGLSVQEALTKGETREHIGNDLPLVYFLCHGDMDQLRRSTVLGIGLREKLTPGDFQGWVGKSRKQRKIWTDPQPLVFINACSSVAIRPESLVDYVSAFISHGGAVGVLGTEVRVAQEVAQLFATSFFRAFLQPGATADRALRKARFELLARGNLIGLAYTPFWFADLTVDFTTVMAS